MEKLQDIPDKVVGDKLFKLLDWNDLLRLRRVSSSLRKMVDIFLKANPDRAPELEINEGKDHSFGAFLEMGIPTTKIFINNSTSGHRFYESEEDKVRQFLEDYGPLITDLRITQITLANNAFCRDKELTFMEGLSSLKSLEVEYCSSGNPETGKKVNHKAPTEDNLKDHLNMPSTFKKLEKIKIGRDPKDTTVGVIERMIRTRDILVRCSKLKYISLPTFLLGPYAESSKTPEGAQLDASGTLPGDLTYLTMSFAGRPADIGFEPAAVGPDGKFEFNLEWFNFENCWEGYSNWLKEKWESSLPFNVVGSKLFLDICFNAKELGLKFLNVSPYLFYAKDFPGINDDPGVGEKINKVGMGEAIVSLVGLDPVIMDVDMPNLERITVPSTNYCVTGGKRAEWPRLKILDICVDGNEGFCWDFLGVTTIRRINGRRAQGTGNVFGFLFCQIERPSVREFYLRFKGVGGKGNKGSVVPKAVNRKRFLGQGDQLRWEREEVMTVPNTGMIVKCLVNLRVLKIGNWQGSNKALLVFWRGFGGGLEEVELEWCGNVTDYTFFGEEEDEGKPEFLKLTNLKKLALKGLDKMERITDLVFERILSKMKLKQLLLTSEKPIEKVTKDGIMGLLQDPFAETIEKFSFRGWSLANVTPREFEEMGKKFRSYNML